MRKEGSGKSETLPLPARELGPIASDSVISARFKLGQESIAVGIGQSLLDLFFGGIWIGIGDIVSDRHVKKSRMLSHYLNKMRLRFSTERVEIGAIGCPHSTRLRPVHGR